MKKPKKAFSSENIRDARLVLLLFPAKAGIPGGFERVTQIMQ
jgi:hypothetical protein